MSEPTHICDDPAYARICTGCKLDPNGPEARARDNRIKATQLRQQLQPRVPLRVMAQQ